MAQPFLGEIEYFGFNFPPKGWATCSGQLMPITQNQALYSLLGTSFGGDGRTTFGLPDLRGRVAVGQGTGTGLSPYSVGQTGGTETVALTVANTPAHNHSVSVVSKPPDPASPSPTGNLLSVGSDGPPLNTYSTTDSITGLMDPSTISTAGGAPHENRMPFGVLTPCIAIAGIYPSRN